MAIQTVNPTVNTTPDIGGSSAVTGISNTGHSSTNTIASAVDIGSGPSQNNTTTKTAKWSSFSAFPAGTINSLHLKLNWDIDGNVAAENDGVGSCDADITYTIDYSLNGGGAWTNALTRTRSISAGGGTSDDDTIDENNAIDITLLTSQNVGQVQVRTSMVSHAFATAPAGFISTASASQTTFITDIKLEADITPTPPAGSAANKVLSVIM